MAKALGVSMKLFGMPYQFPEFVDPRIPDVSDTMGVKYARNIALNAPVLTVLPGKPVYLGGQGAHTKENATYAFLEAAAKDGIAELDSLINGANSEDVKLYDFELAYNEYMDYVNMLCRAGAMYLDLDPEVMPAPDGGSFQQFDWRNYNWTTDDTKGETGSSDKHVKFETGESIIDRIFDAINGFAETTRYVQFYIDPDISPTDSFSNMTAESQIASYVKTPTQLSKELSFMTGNALDGTIDFIGDSVNVISDTVNEILGDGPLTGRLNQIINLGGEAVRGNNIVFPEIYQSSARGKSYSITLHLKTPYGNKYGYYLDIYVPMMHALAMAWPKMASANSYSEPFIIKAYVEGLLSVNLGIVEDASVVKVTETLTKDGLPTEVDVTLNIKDLYLDMSMSSVKKPGQFINNPSLVEYLGTTCGMSMVFPNYKKKFEIFSSGILSYPKNLITSVAGTVSEGVYNAAMRFADNITGVFR